MNANELWELIAGIEAQLPLRQDALEAFFGVTFESTRDHNKQTVLVAKSARYELGLRLPSRDSEGDITVALPPKTKVASQRLFERFPEGHALPPPPPGYGPPDAQGIYIASRPWGQIWFTQYSGDRIVQFTIRPGVHHSPGV